MRMIMEMMKSKRMMATVYTCDRCTCQWMGIELGALDGIAQ